MVLYFFLLVGYTSFQPAQHQLTQKKPVEEKVIGSKPGRQAVVDYDSCGEAQLHLGNGGMGGNDSAYSIILGILVP